MPAKIKYSVRQVTPDIFAIVVPDNKQRAAMFVRAQEYYENESTRIRRNVFNVENFLKQYRREHGADYSDHWQGFNIPYALVLELYQRLPPKHINDYDVAMMHALKRIAPKATTDTYIIGVDRMGSDLMLHELLHARYFVDPAYRRRMNDALDKMPRRMFRQLRRNLRDMDYRNHDYVVRDEMQAYLASNDWTYPEILRGLKRSEVREWHERLQALGT